MMEIQAIGELLKLGFPAVMLVLYFVERGERMRLQREYIDAMRHLLAMPKIEREHEVSVKWNGKDEE